MIKFPTAAAPAPISRSIGSHGREGSHHSLSHCWRATMMLFGSVKAKLLSEGGKEGSRKLQMEHDPGVTYFIHGLHWDGSRLLGGACGAGHYEFDVSGSHSCLDGGVLRTYHTYVQTDSSTTPKNTPVSVFFSFFGGFCLLPHD